MELLLGGLDQVALALAVGGSHGLAHLGVLLGKKEFFKFKFVTGSFRA